MFINIKIDGGYTHHLNIITSNIIEIIAPVIDTRIALAYSVSLFMFFLFLQKYTKNIIAKIKTTLKK